jgi:hypothetical protein
MAAPSAIDCCGSDKRAFLLPQPRAAVDERIVEMKKGAPQGVRL